MRHFALPLLVFSLIGASLFSAQAADQPPAGVEAKLLARVGAFNKLLVAEKYREAEQYVLPVSRESYYTAEKPHILDFEVTKIDWEEQFHAATVEMSSRITLRRAAVGAFQVKSSYYGHWKLEKGDWWFYFPQLTERRTAFGIMKVNPTLAQESKLNVRQEMAKGRAELEAARRKTLTADRLSITLPDKQSSEKVVLTNLMPGPIHLGFQRISGTGFDVVLKAKELAANGTAELMIYRSTDSKAVFKAGAVLVKAFPTGQTVMIQVN